MLKILLVVNLFAFVLYGVDKQRARKGMWRIPESVLILCAVLGGGAGAYLGMRFFHHKTRKPLFAVGVPFLALVEAGVILFALSGGRS